MLFFGDLTIPYLGLIYHCYFYTKKLNRIVTPAGHRAAILFKSYNEKLFITRFLAVNEEILNHHVNRSEMTK